MTRTVSRRRFLRVGIAGGLVLGAGGIFAWQTSGYDVPDSVRRRLRYLSPKEYRVVEAAAEQLVRTTDAAFPPPGEVETALTFDALLEGLEPFDRRDVGRLLQLLEHALPTWAGQPGRFTRLASEERDAVLEAMRTSERELIRAGFEGLKSLVVLAYFRHERTWPALEYAGPIVARPA